MAEETANVTPKELEAAKNKVHIKDTKVFVDGMKKIVRSHKAGTKNMIRLNKYMFKTIGDGWMLKVQIEKFFDSRSGGTRWVKGYLSEEVKLVLEKMMDALPRKLYLDTRDGRERERPERVEKVHRDAPTDLDLENLWNTSK